jgi:hypothetical protein
MLGHPEVCGEDCDEEKDDSPGCGAAGLREQEADAADYLCCAAEQNDLTVGGKIIRHDMHVGAGHDVVTRACCYVKYGHHYASEPPGLTPRVVRNAGTVVML